MSVLQFSSARGKDAVTEAGELLPLSIFNHNQEITISYRGSLAQTASEINCKSGRDDLFLSLVRAKFRGLIVCWENPNVLAIGRLDEVGEYFPDW